MHAAPPSSPSRCRYSCVVASFGGIGYAASSAVDVVHTAKRVVVAPAKPKLREVNKSAAQDQYKPEKVTICHRTGSGKG